MIQIPHSCCLPATSSEKTFCLSQKKLSHWDEARQFWSTPAIPSQWAWCLRSGNVQQRCCLCSPKTSGGIDSGNWMYRRWRGSSQTLLKQKKPVKHHKKCNPWLFDFGSSKTFWQSFTTSVIDSQTTSFFLVKEVCHRPMGMWSFSRRSRTETLDPMAPWKTKHHSCEAWINLSRRDVKILPWLDSIPEFLAKCWSLKVCEDSV